jgi:hypothetical protein
LSFIVERLLTSWLIRDRLTTIRVVDVVVVQVAVGAVEIPGVVGVVPTGKPPVDGIQDDLKLV